MRYYNVPDENASYFYRTNVGICRKNNFSGAEPELVVKGALDGFGLFRNKDTHIICTDENNEITYIKYGKDPVRVLSGKDGVRPYDFSVTDLGEYLDLYYKAEYENEILLFRYILGSSDKPKAIMKLLPEHTEYAFGDGKIFCTSEKGMFGYIDVTTHEHGEFVPLCKSGYMPYFTELNGEKYLVYCDGENIVINGEVTVSDPHALTPVLFCFGEKMYLQWRSGSFVRYMMNEDGIHWSQPMRYIGNGENPVVITYAGNNCKHSCYGFKGKPYTPALAVGSDDKFIRSELGEIKKQVSVLKNELKNINSMHFFK